MEKTNAEILKDILQVAKAELNEAGSIGYTMPDGKHHIFISVEENASWDRVKEKSYIVEPNWVVDGAHEPMGDTYGVPYNDFAELLVGCAWCLDWFQAEREAVMVQNYDDAIAHLVATKAQEGGLLGFCPVFESTNYFGLYSGSWEDDFFLVHKATGAYTTALRASDPFGASSYLKELENEDVRDVASVRLLDKLIHYVRVGLLGHDLPAEEYAGIKVLEGALEQVLDQKGKQMLRLGSEVAYNGYTCEVLNVQDGVVFLENAANDYHWHIPVKRFLDEATLIAEPAKDDGKGCNRVMKDHFEIEATVTVLDAGSAGWSLQVAGDDLATLKTDVIPAVQKLCAEHGYVEGAAVLEMKIEKNLEHFDREEEMFDLEDLNACITVYRDTLGLPEELDNLTEIVVPKEWLKNVLTSEGVDDMEQWLDTYTADETIGIAEKAFAEGALLACTDMPFHLGTKVEYGYRLREVVGFEDGRVCLQDVNDDSHCEPTLAEFFRGAAVVREEDISISADDLEQKIQDAQRLPSGDVGWDTALRDMEGQQDR